jgi:hypothetical protein
MRNIFFAIGLAMLLSITGCTKCNRPAFSSGSVECQRVERFWRELETDKVKMIAFFGEDSNEPVDECPFEEFKAAFYQLTGCCFSKPHPLAGEWVEYNRLECIRKYLEKENIQKIAFYGDHGVLLDFGSEPPETWHPWAEIIEPGRIKEVTKLLLKAMEKEGDRFANEVSPTMPMQIITDKHKFVIEVSDYNNAICGIGWTSHELRKKLEQWGFLEPKKVRSAQETADSLALCVETSRKQAFELMAQHKWLKHRLDKCLEKLEAERGLSPIPVENPAAKMYVLWRGGKIDPNETLKYAPKPEPFYVPYEEPNQRGLPNDRHYEIPIITALLGLQCTATAMYMSDSKDWIENFEKRLKRLDPNQPE